MKILKFGGTSVQYADNMRQVLQIISKYQNEKILIVLSACRGITDNLIKLADAAASTDSGISSEILQIICKHHYVLIDELKMSPEYKSIATESISKLLAELRNIVEGINLLKELTIRTRASVLSFGELLSTTVFEIFARANGLKTIFADARKSIVIDHDGYNTYVDFEESLKHTQEYLIPRFNNESNIVITQGFIVADQKGFTSVLSRGGSDYSAAVFASLLNADEIQIWTDVSGIYTSDPRYYPNAKTIPNITFSEVRELSYFGAKVLHPDTVKPAIEHSIPVRVLNTHKPDDLGTLLSNTPTIESAHLSAIVAVSKLYSSEITIPPDYKSSEFFILISRLLDSVHGKVYITNSNAGKIKIISDAKIDDEFVGELEVLTNENISAICISANNLITNFSTELFSKITKIITNYKIEYFAFSSNECINIALSDEQLPDIYNQLHNLILESEIFN